MNIDITKFEQAIKFANYPQVDDIIKVLKSYENTNIITTEAFTDERDFHLKYYDKIFTEFERLYDGYGKPTDDNNGKDSFGKGFWAGVAVMKRIFLGSKKSISGQIIDRL